MRTVSTVLLLWVLYICPVVLGQATSRRETEPPVLHYRGLQHTADGRLATDLTLAKGATFTTTIEFPEAQRYGIKKTWACWLFPEDTWAIGGNSELELCVDDVSVTHFAVARGEWKVLIQSLVRDATRRYKITLRNVGGHDVFIRELWLRWLAAAQ